MNSTLRLDVSINDGIHTVSIAGELDAGSVADLADCLSGCREPGARVLLDLRDLNFMDSAGLELLDRTYVESSLEGWTFAVITTGERYVARAAAYPPARQQAAPSLGSKLPGLAPSWLGA